jgi:flagellar protein FlbD
MVNSDLIKFVEKSPDTVITLITGEKLIVREPIEIVLQRVVQFRRSIQPVVDDQSSAGCDREG